MKKVFGLAILAVSIFAISCKNSNELSISGKVDNAGEIKKVLQAVKTEFKLFGDVLNAAQKKILNAHDDIDKLVGTRTKQIQRKLKDFEDLPVSEANSLLGELEDNNAE